ncbi:MAG: DUF6056 family protein [Clostridium sp.]|nr:DUF6056 family protein [Prevotella sp.]MCM1429681.1 DUF6056 family protein [Clostridium sp.]
MLCDASDRHPTIAAPLNTESSARNTTMTPSHSIFSSKTLHWIIIAIALITAIPFILVADFVFPVYDDFHFALDHENTSALQSVVESYRHWSGRYLGTFLSSANPFAVSDNPLPLFKTFSAISVILTLVTFLFSPLILCRRQLGYLKSFSLGAFLFIVFITLLPSPAQAFYWFSTITSFTIPSLMGLLFLCLLRVHNIIGCCICAILAFLIPGGNEVTAVLLVMTLTYLSLTLQKRRFFVYVLLSIIGIVIVILSPGNAVRMAASPLSSHPCLWTLCVSVGQTISWAYLWLPPMLLASIIYIPLWGLDLCDSGPFKNSVYIGRFKVTSLRSRFILFAIYAVVAVFLAHIPPTLGLNSIMTDRTANCLLLFFAIFFFWGITLLLGGYKRPVVTFCNKLKPTLLYVVAFTIILTTVWSPFGNFATAIADIISGEAYRYEQSNLRRVEYARAVAVPDSVTTLPPLEAFPATIYVRDFPDDPNDAVIEAYASLFEIHGKVTVKEEEPRFMTNYQALKQRGKSERN